MVSVPIEAEFSSVSFSYNITEFRNNISISPTQPKIPISVQIDSLFFVPPDPAYYSVSQYPSDPCVYVSTHIMRTYKVFCFQVSPFIYYPTSNQLKMITSGELSISYTTTYQPNPNRWDDGSRADFVRMLVINPEDVINSPLPEPLETDVKYMIITDENWISDDVVFDCGYFQSFIDWKTQKGLKAEIVSVQSIYSNYQGSTNQERIKRCIEFYHINKRTEWVLLYGSPEIVPSPLIKVPMNEYDLNGDYCNIESDLFYACFDGDYSWHYGEGSGHPVHHYNNDVDLLPEVSIGRVAYNNFGNNVYLHKSQAYEQTPPSTDFASKALLTGAHLFHPSFPPYHRSDTDWFCEGMWNNYIQPYWAGGNRYRLYDTSSDLGPLTVHGLYNALADGYNIVLESSHGNTQRWAIEWIGDIDNLWNCFTNSSVPTTNGTQNKYGLLYSIACLTNYFGPLTFNGTGPYPWGYGDNDTKCLGTAFLESDGGGVVYIGNTSYGLGNPWWNPQSSFDDWGPSWDYARRFFPQLFTGLHDSHYSVGLCFDLSRALMIPAVNQGSDDCETFIMFSLNLQGDPELSIYSADPTAFNVTLPARLFWDELGAQNNISLATGQPFARVCISNGDELYKVFTTDSNGYLNCSIILRSPQSLTVTITGRNKYPFVGQIPVVPANIRGSVTLNLNPEASIYTRVMLFDISGNMIAETNPNVNGEFIIGVNPGPTQYYLRYELFRPDQGSLYYPVKSDIFSVPDNSTIITLPLVILIRFTNQLTVSQTLPLNSCFQHIQDAVDCALTYSVPLVLVQSGSYYENLTINPAPTSNPYNLEIRGSGVTTVIDGSYSNTEPCIDVSIGTQNPLNLKIKNLTIQNGSRGIRADFLPYLYPGNNAQTTEFRVEYCIIKDNGNIGNSTEGAGIYSAGPISIVNTKFINNSGIHSPNIRSTGGGAYLTNNSVFRSTIISSCEFVGNSASQSGGLHLTGLGRFELRYNTIKSNFHITGFVNNVFCEAVADLDLYGNVLVNDISPNNGSGHNLLVWGCGTIVKPASIRNNTISGNLASLQTNSTGLTVQGANCFATVENNIIQGSSVGIHKADPQSQLGIRHCLFWNNTENFLGFSYDSASSPGCLINRDPLLDSYYLPRWDSSVISPCIDSGIGSPDTNDGTPPDIGAKRTMLHKYWNYTFGTQADQDRWHWVSYPVLNTMTNGALMANAFFSDLLKTKRIVDNGELKSVPLYLEEIQWSIQGNTYCLAWNDGTENWGDQEFTHLVTSQQGYKVKLKQLQESQDIIKLIESGFQTPSSANISIYGEVENWLGYYHYEAAWPHDAFSAIWDDITMIKTKDWCLIRSRAASDYWGMSGKVYPLKHGDMVIIRTSSNHTFQWDVTDPIIPETKSKPEYFEYEEKPDYVPVYITLTDVDITNLKEIGLYLNGVCKGAVVVESDLEQLCAFLDIDESLHDGSVEFVFYYNDSKNQEREMRTIRIDEDKIKINYIDSNALYPYYDVVLDQGAIENIIPPTFSLNQNYPNPFNPSTTISYQIPQTGSIRIDIFNIKGQKIRTLINELKHPGKHSVVWNGTDQSGRQVASGIYYYRIVTDHNSSTKKMLLLK